MEIKGSRSVGSQETERAFQVGRRWMSASNRVEFAENEKESALQAP